MKKVFVIMFAVILMASPLSLEGCEDLIPDDPDQSVTVEG